MDSGFPSCGDCAHYIPLYIKMHMAPDAFAPSDYGMCLLQSNTLIPARQQEICKYFRQRLDPKA